jgi:hypothetical protein
MTRHHSKDQGYRVVPVSELLRQGAPGMASGSGGD